MAFFTLADDQQICFALVRESHELEIGATQNDVTTHAADDLAEHRQANFFHAFQLASDIQMHHRLVALGERRNVHRMYAHLFVLLCDRSRESERIPRVLGEVDADCDHEFMCIS